LITNDRPSSMRHPAPHIRVVHELHRDRRQHWDYEHDRWVDVPVTRQEDQPLTPDSPYHGMHPQTSIGSYLADMVLQAPAMGESGARYVGVVLTRDGSFDITATPTDPPHRAAPDLPPHWDFLP
jgi:hypothetical protein